MIKTIAAYGVDEHGHCKCPAGANCKSAGKHPIGPWRTAPKDPTDGDNVGHPTGPEYGYWVLDVDVKPDRDGRKTLEKWLPTVPDTRIVKTPSGGYHIYFRYPESGHVYNDVQRRLGPGLDIRGMGGFVVGAGSRNAQGAYTLVKDRPIGSATEKLLEAVTAEPVDTTVDPAPAIRETPFSARIARALAYVQTMDPAVEGQGGDAQTFKAGCVGHAFAIPEHTWCEYLLEVYNPRCEPPWEPEDFRVKVANAYKYANAPYGHKLVDTQRAIASEHAEALGVEVDEGDAAKIRHFFFDSMSDSEMAEVFLRHHGDTYSVDDTLYMYIDYRWQVQSRNDLWRRVMQFYNGATAYIKERGKNGKDIVISMNAAKIRAVVTVIEHQAPTMHRDEINAKQLPHALSVRGGIVQVTADGPQWVMHNPDNAAAQHLDVDLRGASVPTHWLTLLDKVFDGPERQAKIDLLQEFLGASMTGSAPEFDRAIMLHGSGGNGKSSIMKVAQEALFDRECVTSVTPGNMYREYYRAELVSSLLNEAGEIPAQAIRDSSHIKAIITGDLLEGRRLHEQPIRFTPRAGHIFSANDLPNVSDATEGFWRRFIVLKLEHVFDGTDRREDIVARCLTEREGIIVWALQGLQRLLKNKTYTIPPSSASEGEMWREEANPVNAFAADVMTPEQRCDETAEFSSNAKLYAAFKQWYRDYTDGSSTYITQIGFSRKLVALGYHRTKRGNKRGFLVSMKAPNLWEVSV